MTRLALIGCGIMGTAHEQRFDRIAGRMKWGARGTRLGYAFHAHATEAMLELDQRKDVLLLHRNGREPEVLLQGEGGGKHTDREMAHFLDCVETQPAQLSTMLERRRVLSWLAAALQLCAAPVFTGAAIPLPARTETLSKTPPKTAPAGKKAWAAVPRLVSARAQDHGRSNNKERASTQ